MKLSIADYAEQTAKLLETERQRTETERRRLEEIGTMTLEEHLELIKTIIQGHVGAKYIKIWYDVVGVNKSIVKEEVARELCHRDWYVGDIQNSEGIMISNFEYVNQTSQCEYDDYPYRKFTVRSKSSTAIDFWVDVSARTFETQIERLMTFKDKIRVQLWDLVILKERICKLD